MSDLNMESTYKKDKESETKTDQPSFNIWDYYFYNLNAQNALID